MKPMQIEQGEQLYKRANMTPGWGAQSSYGSRLAAGTAASAIGGYGIKKLTTNLHGPEHMQTKTAEEVAFLAFNDELNKLAEDAQTKSPEPPKWLTRAAQAGGFILGASMGAAAGDAIARKVLKAPSAGTVNAAKTLGAGAIGATGLLLMPKIQKLTNKHLFGIDEKEKPDGSRSSSN